MKNKSGITLIELMIVLATLGLLGVLTPAAFTEIITFNKLNQLKKSYSEASIEVTHFTRQKEKIYELIKKDLLSKGKTSTLIDHCFRTNYSHGSLDCRQLSHSWQSLGLTFNENILYKGISFQGGSDCLESDCFFITKPLYTTRCSQAKCENVTLAINLTVNSTIQAKSKLGKLAQLFKSQQYLTTFSLADFSTSINQDMSCPNGTFFYGYNSQTRKSKCASCLNDCGTSYSSYSGGSSNRAKLELDPEKIYLTESIPDAYTISWDLDPPTGHDKWTAITLYCNIGSQSNVNKSIYLFPSGQLDKMNYLIRRGQISFTRAQVVQGSSYRLSCDIKAYDAYETMSAWFQLRLSIFPDRTSSGGFTSGGGGGGGYSYPPSSI